MIQQVVAIIIIIFFVFRLLKQKKEKNIKINEFYFWLIFWILAMLLIFFIKPIDQLVIKMGFSSSGINLLFYLAVVFLFYLIFKIRLKMLKLEKNITDLAREISLNKK